MRMRFNSLFKQGERRFSRWKGSVVDSVVGVFLTQNVSDHLSSSAFMALVSRFQLQSRTNCGNTAERAKNSPEEPKVSTVDIEKWQDKLLNQGLSDQGSMTMHEYGFVEEEMEHSIESVANNVVFCTADYSKDKQTIICENGQKMTQESEEDRTYIARELEDVISQNSSGLNFNIADKTGLVSESNPEVVNVVFKELLQMQEEKMFNELNHHGNRSLQSDVTVEGANTIELSSESSSEAENVVNRFKSYQFMDLLQMQEHKVFPEMNHQGNMSLQSDVTVEGVDVENTVSSFDGGQSASGLSTHLATLCHSPQKQEDTLNTSKNMTLADPESVEVSADEIISFLSSTASEILQIKHSTSVEKTNGPGVENATEFMDLPPCSQCDSCAPESELRAHLSPEPEFRVLEPSDQMQDSRLQTCLPNFNILGETVGVREWSRLVDTETTIKGNKVESSSKDEPHSFKKGAAETAKNKVTKNGAKPDNIDWDSLRRQAYSKGPRKERSHDATDTLDYEAVRCSDVNEISDTIKVRGMNNRLAERIKDFLNRLVQDHGSIDLEWLRDVPPDKTKDYLLSLRGLGLKSVECVRLLALHHVSFPVDTNVARICVRLGWVPLEPLPESVQMHLLEMYPFMDSVQKYLWPRLCKLDELTLYELHYQMITFGKVFCKKSKPNCNACPMRGECKHFASAFASARLALPRPEEKGLVTSAVSLTASEQYDKMFANLLPLPPLKRVSYSQEALGIPGSEPIIEEPASPEHGTSHPSEVPMEEIFDASENDIEDVSRLRTEHLVYELPDSHTLLKGLDPREPDDICPYLLAIWSPGETAQSTQPHVFSCNSQDTVNLCDKETCYVCNTVREANAQTVRGTLLIPSRTAMRGSFPLNGTYFQINEMFADHESSLQPIDVPRTLIWNLPRRTVYFGTSVPTIFRGLTAEEIQLCFWREGSFV